MSQASHCLLPLLRPRTVKQEPGEREASEATQAWVTQLQCPPPTSTHTIHQKRMPSAGGISIHSFPLDISLLGISQWNTTDLAVWTTDTYFLSSGGRRSPSTTLYFVKENVRSLLLPTTWRDQQPPNILPIFSIQKVTAASLYPEARVWGTFLWFVKVRTPWIILGLWIKFSFGSLRWV